jgi:hypothetical protein
VINQSVVIYAICSCSGRKIIYDATREGDGEYRKGEHGAKIICCKAFIQPATFPCIILPSPWKDEKTPQQTTLCTLPGFRDLSP